MINITKFEDFLNEEEVAVRPIYQIAADIQRDWRPVNFAAKPYLEAMHSLDKIEDNYLADSGNEIVNKFLGNAGSWRGDVAKKIKAELKEIVKKSK